MRKNTFAVMFFFVTYLFFNNAHGNHEGETPPIISKYSMPDDKTISFNQREGTILSESIEGASGVEIINFGSQSKPHFYFMKDKTGGETIKERQDVLRQALDSIIATRLLNRINDDFYRFPNLTLGYSADDEFSVNFKVFSEGLAGFKSINKMNEHKIQKIDLKDLENLYISLILVGGGDPHGDNIFYSATNAILSNIDFDVSFKTHISRNAQAKKEEKRGHANFRPLQSDLAVRDFDCSFPYSNFLTTTDTLLDRKPDHYRHYLEDKINKHEISSVAIRDAIRRVLKVPLRDLTDRIERVVATIRDELKHLNNGHVGETMSFFYSDDYKSYLLDFVTRRYHFFQCLNDTAFLEDSMDNIKCARCLEDSCKYARSDNDLGVCNSNNMCWIKPFF